MSRKESQILGMAMKDATSTELTAELESVVPETIALVTDTYTKLIQWSYKRAAKDLVASLDPVYISRMALRAMKLKEAVDPDELRMKLTQTDLIPSGEETRYLAKEVVFPPLDAGTVKTILERSNWGDGLTYAQRLEGWGRHADFAGIASRLRSGIAAGQNVTELEHSLRPLMDFDYQARRIARTESLRVAEAANRETWKDLGEDMEGVQIIATIDSHTRPEHAARDGAIFTRDLDGQYTNAVWGLLPDLPDEPNSVLPGNLCQGRVQAASKARYSGQAVELVTDAGWRCTVTANHPVATPSGFVDAGSIAEGDELLCHSGQTERFGSRRSVDHVYDPPALIENIFKSLCQVGTLVRTPAAIGDFHGEAAFYDGDVEIVTIQRVLLPNRHPAFHETISDFLFKNTDHLRAERPSYGHLPKPRVGHGLPPVSGATGSGNAGTVPVPSVADLRRIGPASQLDIVLGHAIREEAAAVAGVFAQLVERFPCTVLSEKVVKVRHFKYTGHVFDLQTATGYMVANSASVPNCRLGGKGGILLSNCRCWSTPVLVDAGPSDVLHTEADEQWLKDHGFA